MKNERDITKDLKPLRPQIPPTSYFHQLADTAIQHESLLPRKKNYKMFGYTVASLAACWMLILWLLPNAKSGHHKATLAKTESHTSFHYPSNYHPKKPINSAPPIPEKVNRVKSSPQKMNKPNDLLELDLSSLSPNEVLTYLDEEEIDVMELEEVVNGNY